MVLKLDTSESSVGNVKKCGEREGKRRLSSA
jgi:hypothetical protein